MIEHMRIQNVALIEEIEIQFHEGLNILTGETGAGKSILIDSINFLLGERPGKDFLRTGAQTALVEGLVRVVQKKNIEAIQSMGVEIEEDDLLFIARSLNAAGRSVCRVNGRGVSIGMLRDISAMLVDIHGQHDHQSLLNPERHITLLDQFCGAETAADLRELAETLRDYREIFAKIKSVAGNEKDKASRVEILRYQINEIDSAKLSENEEETLTQRRTALRAAEKLAQKSSEAIQWLKGGAYSSPDDGAAFALGHAVSLVQEIAALDGGQKELAARFTSVQESLEEVTGELLRYTESLEENPSELESVEERLDLLYRLKKKYGGGVLEILSHYKRVENELLAVVEADKKRLEWEKTKKAFASKMLSLCARLSDRRKTRAAAIQNEIEAGLCDLGMKSARFTISIERKNEFGLNGYDKVEFLISPNRGETLKPLAKIASGGEMSRAMLALKTVMADADTIETFIFDEIDAGVSGRAAQQVAEKLAYLAKGRQILCITHLPQIAAMADSHYLIEKTSDEHRTATKVFELDRPRMIAELARLIGGAKITDQTLKAAAEMKELASKATMLPCCKIIDN